MIEDKELDALELKLQEQMLQEKSVSQEYKSAFSEKMDDVKQQVLMTASQEDKKFVETVVENVKDAAVTYTQVEQKKAEYEKQKVQYESEKLDTQQKANANQAAEDKWLNRQKRREYHFNGVKPIMTFVGINDPMNLLFLYTFSIVLIIPFFIAKLFKGTIGALLCGAEDANRSKAAKGFIWTIISAFTLLVLFCLIYLFLQWQGIDILKSKS